MLRLRRRRVGFVVLVALFVAGSTAAAEPKEPEGLLAAYISTGDNHWLGSSLPIDSKATIEASIDLLARLGVRRIYWRGLQEAVWHDTMLFREENPRYASLWHWIQHLYPTVDPDRTASAAAHRRGIEFWGVGSMFDWGSGPDTPCSGDFPHNSESRLRIEHPEWVPVDRSGHVRQGGPIELAYPEARKALVDLHMKFVRRDGYDGVVFLTYVENYGMRFQDEFGYSEPIVKEFKRRTGVDLLKQPFTRSGSRYDWYALRGQYVTEYLRDLKRKLAADGKKLGMFVNPQQPRMPQPWNVPELLLTAGAIQMDLDTWVRDGIVDRFVVYGYCNRERQERTIEDCLWLARATPTAVSCLTSSPTVEAWQPFRRRGVEMITAVHEEAAWLERCGVPEQQLSALEGDDPLLTMRFLAQVSTGKAKAPAASVVPLAGHANPIVRRLVLLALGQLKEPESLPVIERGLADPENAVRCAAALALRDLAGPQSPKQLLAALEKHPTHPLAEIAVVTLMRLKPFPSAELLTAAKNSPAPLARASALRALAPQVTEPMVDTIAAALNDPDRYVRFAAAFALGHYVRSMRAVDVLIAATRHEDPVVSNRAATSLAMIAARGLKETQPKQAAILSALKALYASLGDGCQRADADWGYRPVGNALLKIGPEGEQVLREFMNQTRDRRLADQAWRSLYIRQDNGRFSEVTEPENEAAMKARPAWLDGASAQAQ